MPAERGKKENDLWGYLENKKKELRKYSHLNADYGVVDDGRTLKSDAEYLRQLRRNHPNWPDHDLDVFFGRMTGRRAPGIKVNPRTYYSMGGGWAAVAEPPDFEQIEAQYNDRYDEHFTPRTVLIFVGEDSDRRLGFSIFGAVKEVVSPRPEDEKRTYGFSHVGQWFRDREERLAGSHEPTEVKVFAIDRVSRINKELSRHKNIAKVILIGHAGRWDDQGFFAAGAGSLPETNTSARLGGCNVDPSDIYWGNLGEDAQLEVVGCNSEKIAQEIADASGKPVFGTTDYLNFKDGGLPFFRNNESRWVLKHPVGKNRESLLFP